MSTDAEAGAEHDALIQVFLEETREQLQQLEEGLMTLHAERSDPERLRGLFRLAHTIKGNSMSVGFQAAGDFAHVLEDLLDRLQRGKLDASKDVVGTLLESVDVLSGLITAAVTGGPPPSPAALVHRIDELTQATGTAGDGPAEDHQSPAEAAPASFGAPPPAAAAPSLRIAVSRLDRLLDLTAEIAIARERAMARLQALEGDPIAESVLETLHEADKLHLELQELVTKVRMVPLGPFFRRQLRTVRDVADALGKEVRVEVEGEDVELDTRIIDELRDPLTHLVRNVVDHGIEPPAQRAACGKAPCGLVRLSARHEAGAVVIEVSDDGAGLARERILSRAHRLGLVPEDAQLSGPEVDALVFEPGFSTADVITEYSGRGVGLDVVRRNVESLRGTVSIQSQRGVGTTITARLPLTLAIIEGLSVAVGDETLVVPVDPVVECLEVPRGVDSLREGRGTLDLRGSPLPCLRLRDHFGLDGAAPEREFAVVVRHGANLAGLVVDRLVGGSQVLVKPLGELFRDVSGVAGSALLGTGRVALVIDVPAILRDAEERPPSDLSHLLQLVDRVHDRAQSAGPNGGPTC